MGVLSSLWFPPLALVWAALLLWQRLRHGSWGVSLAFLSRSGRRAFVAIGGGGLAVVVALYAAAIAGHGGAHVAPVVGGLVTAGLLAIVALDVVLAASITVAGAATRPRRRR
jgi:hypothetical protein